LGKEDQVTDDTITSEEKWSLYVDQFVQLSSPENQNPKRKDPFSKRNLPAQVGEEPPLNVETRSGLELKICVNTYKIFFVDNTEDYFRRKSGGPLSAAEKQKSADKMNAKRISKFREWINSENGWKCGASNDEVQSLEKKYLQWRNGTN
jgi:paired amphipathic helix protein Sin3a